MTIRKVIAVFFLATSFSVSWAGKLSGFEDKVGGTTRHGSADNDNDDDDDDCGFLCILLQILLSGGDDEDEDDEVASHGRSSESRWKPAQAQATSSSSGALYAMSSASTTISDLYGSEYKPGEALMPVMELQWGKEWPGDGVSSYGLDMDIGISLLVMGVGFQSFQEPSAGDTLNHVTFDIGLRLPLGDQFRIDLVGGPSYMAGEEEHSGKHFGLAARWLPNPRVALFADYALHVYGTSVVNDLEGGMELNLPYIGLRGGYQTLTVSGESLHGPFARLVLRL